MTKAKKRRRKLAKNASNYKDFPKKYMKKEGKVGVKKSTKKQLQK